MYSTYTCTCTCLQYSLTHSSYFSQCYGYDCQKRSNLLAIDTDTLLFTAGNYLVFVSISTGGHTYLRSLGGKSIGAITVSIILNTSIIIIIIIIILVHVCTCNSNSIILILMLFAISLYALLYHTSMCRVD